MISHRHASNSSEIGQNPANVILDVALAIPNSNTLVSSAAFGADVALAADVTPGVDVAIVDDVAGGVGLGWASTPTDFGASTAAVFFFLPKNPIRDVIRDALMCGWTPPLPPATHTNDSVGRFLDINIEHFAIGDTCAYGSEKGRMNEY